LVDDDISKGSKRNIGRKTNNQTSDAPPIGVRFRARKRVYAENLPTKAQRSKRINSRPDASLPPSGNHVPPPSHPDVSQQVDRPAGTDGATNVVPQADGHNNLGTEDCNDELHENTMVADANTQPACNTLMTNEGNCLFVYLPYWILHY